MFANGFTRLAILGLATYLATNTAVALPTEAAVDAAADLPYPLVDMNFTGDDGAKAVGTAQEVAKKLDIKIDVASSTVKDEKPTLVARNKIQPPICTPQGNPADLGAINSGISYLRGLTGRCGVNGRSCARISCSYNAAIFLCNDRPEHIDPSCTYLSGYGTDIVNRCKFVPNLPFSPTVKGQEFDTDNYNILIKSDSC